MGRPHPVNGLLGADSPRHVKAIIRGFETACAGALPFMCVTDALAHGGAYLRGFAGPHPDHGISTGNIRELENKIQRAVLLSEGPLVEPQDLGFDAKSIARKTNTSDVRTLKEAKEAVEKEMVMLALDKFGGNIAKSAEELGISRPTLYELMEKLEVGKK